MHSRWSLLGRAITVSGASAENYGSDAPTKEGHIEAQDKTGLGDDVVGTGVDGKFEEAKTDGADLGDTVGGDGGARSASDNTRDAYQKACWDIIKGRELMHPARTSYRRSTQDHLFASERDAKDPWKDDPPTSCD